MWTTCASCQSERAREGKTGSRESTGGEHSKGDSPGGSDMSVSGSNTSSRCRPETPPLAEGLEADIQYGPIENPPNWPPGSASTGAARTRPPNEEATIRQRLFFQGLVQEPVPLDYDQAAIDSALEWLKFSPPEPFVLFIPLIYPHVPFRVKDPYYSQYREVELPKRAKNEDRTGYEPKFHEHIRREHGLERASEEDWEECMRVYVSCLACRALGWAQLFADSVVPDLSAVGTQ